MISLLLSHLRQPAALAIVSLPLFGASLNAQTTNWTAYNDHTPGTTAGWSTAPWTTTYNMRGVAGGNAGTVLSGNLTNFDTGAQVPAVFTSTRITADPDDFGSMSYPSAGTPAYVFFNGKIDIGNAQSGIGIRASSGSQTRLTFSNLDPSKQYVFRGASVRGGSGGTYNRRWTLCTIEGADAFVDAHSAGVYTAVGTMTAGQASYMAGDNVALGAVVGWNAISPGADGTFSVRCEQYADNPLPNGLAPAPEYGYGICAMMLAEIETGPPFAPTNQNVNLPADATVPACANLVLASSFLGSPAPTYLWFRNGVPMDTMANPSAATASLALNNIQTANAGTYHVRVSNGSGTAVSRDATVAVTVGAPHIASVTAMSSNANSFLFTFDVPVNAGSMDVFSISFASRNGLAGNLGETATAAVQLTPTTVVVTSDLPRSPGVNYIANIVSDAAVVDTCAGAALVPTNLNVYTEAALADYDDAADLWHYDETGADRGTEWTAMNYDDSAWFTGPAFFGLETATQVLGPIRTPWTISAAQLTYYLRKFANVPAPSSQIVSLTLHQQVDDGSVTYINGIEVERHGFAAGVTVTNTSLAANEAEPQALISTSLGVTNVVEGRNVIAVEVHQSSTTSSDVLYGSKLLAVCRTIYPGLTIARSGSTATVSWPEYGVDGQLQTSSDLNSWVTDGRTPVHSGGTYSLTFTIPAGGGHLYIRLRP